MKYTEADVIQFFKENGIGSAELWYTDCFGVSGCINVPAEGLGDCFAKGFELDGMRLFPDPEGVMLLPRLCSPGGRSAIMLCGIRYPDGTEHEGDGRTFLRHAAEYARGCGYRFKARLTAAVTLTENGSPADRGGEFSVFPENRCGGFLRELTGMLRVMGIPLVGCWHGEGGGQCVVSLGYAEPVEAADRLIALKNCALHLAHGDGRTAQLKGEPLAIRLGCTRGAENIFTRHRGGLSPEARAMTGAVLEKAGALSVLCAPGRQGDTAWSETAPLTVRTQVSDDEDNGLELRLADMECDPYFLLGLMIYISIEGARSGTVPPEPDKPQSRLPENVAQALQELERLGELLPEEVTERLAERIRGIL